MNYLYLLINLGSFSIPFLYSFHPKLKFYKLWKPLFFGILINFIIFIPWDIIFTQNNIWGFNPYYFLGITIANLPLEEYLFFICIPYACVFTHFALLHYFPKLELKQKLSSKLGLILSLSFFCIATYNWDKWYTLIDFLLASILLLIALIKFPEILQRYFLTFLVMLIPFFIVNGVLTGSFIQNEVVWYNNQENLSIRMFTIPIEDAVYAFSMILINLIVIHFYKQKVQ
ncbi:lycopene cyclase domain-containing protein [Tamlana sp. 62-3]|uniref:Lycopene cyclase domain-containing protein n=1 Tax=Neotamlana sargassicola TaxID=2883125 RepID=A0A9X1L854_9FLAO|nr:lycopene cyclase domain-containing protein [Tamlana sargassicola]MCB4809194.1 lycopene cyclase domain-containing protein [Tamlana sargassicola]